MTEKIVDQWDGCYPSNWKGLIVEDAFAHPAKFSSKLIRKIYDHILAEGWVKPGDIIVDPFGGVALGALDAMRLGLSWRGCELEERFVRFGNDNIRFWNKKFSSMPKWSGDAVLLQGDSRMLSQVLCGAHASVSSPPYADGCKHNGGDDPGQSEFMDGPIFIPGLNAAVASPPYAETEITGERNFKSAENPDGRSAKDVHRGRDKGYQGAVSSPPYADSINSENGIDLEKLGTRGPNSQAGSVTRYGVGEAQLGAMKATADVFRASITSPPFQATTGGVRVTATEGPLAEKGLFERHAAGNMNVGYGDTEGNIGTYAPDDFWISARAIVEQVYMVLDPGAHAVWVVKDYVKNKERVPFCAQWQQMCEAVGFVTLHEHHAMLVRHKGISTTDMDGKVVSHEISSKSFFRRLAEKKGSPKIDFETVLCMVKPA